MKVDFKGVMSIVNVTPDSFYSGSRALCDQQVVSAVQCAVAEGAKIVDLGAYSTRPGAEVVPVDVEFQRLDRAFAAVVGGFSSDSSDSSGALGTSDGGEAVDYSCAMGDGDFVSVGEGVVFSVDTFRAEVVERLYDRWGAFVVNDISAGELDPRMINTVGRLGLPYIAMHSKGDPKTMGSLTLYDDLVGEVYSFLEQKVLQCRAAGIEQVVVDPGFGFAKTVDHNFELLRGLSCFKKLEVPLLVGMSRKSFVWRTLGIKPGDALAGTVAMNWQALVAGADMLRVHDTLPAVELFKLYSKFNVE